MGKDYRKLRKIIFNEELNKKYDDVREDNWRLREKIKDVDRNKYWRNDEKRKKERD